MTEVFGDTYYFPAILGSDETERLKAFRAGRAAAKGLVTTAWVMTEVAGFMRQPHERAAFVELVQRLEASKHAVLLPVESLVWRRGLALYAGRLDKSWSLVDCISFTVMSDRGIADALTGDHHFEQAG